MILAAIQPLISKADTASDCGPDVRIDQPGPWGTAEPNVDPKNWQGSMQHVNPRNQGDLGDCYAESAAQMSDAFRFSHAAPTGDRYFGHQTSALEAAISATKHHRAAYHSMIQMFSSDPTARKLHDIWGGLACDVFESLKEKGSCSNERVLEAKRYDGTIPFSSTLSTENTSDLTNDHLLVINSKLLISLQGFAHDWRQPLGNDWGFGTPGDLSGQSPPAIDLRAELACRLQADLDIKPIVETLLPSSQAIRRLLQNDDFGPKLITLACAKNRIEINSQATCVGPNSDLKVTSEKRKFVQEWFEKSSPIQPLSISFCGNLLMNGPAFKASIYSSECGNHEALVIGKRWNSNQNRCEFLVRNSWGTDANSRIQNWEYDCTQYKLQNGTCLDGATDSHGNCLRPEHSNQNCEYTSGSVWVDANALSANTYSFSHIQLSSKP